MRVALCFWGICRSTDRIIESIETCIFNPLINARIFYDVYLHTYKLYRPYTNIRSNETGLQLKNTIWKLLKPTEAKIENQDEVDKALDLKKYRSKGDPWGNEKNSKNNEDLLENDYSTLDNHIRALYSLSEVTKLWSQSDSTYDLVIYLRPDVRFMTPLSLNWLDVRKGLILIPDFHLFYGCNDRFAIGVPKDMKVYGERFYSAYEYSLQKPLHSEQFLSNHIVSYGIEFKTIPIRFRRVRADGHTCNTDKDL
jgi:hypothetical protein